jgi:hypothetical protein
MLRLLTILHWIACLNPGIETAKDGSDVRKAFINQYQSRTGAGFFFKSGAIGNDPCFWIKLPHAGGQVGKWDGQRPRDVTNCI